MSVDRARVARILQRTKLFERASRASRDAATEQAALVQDDAEAVLASPGDRVDDLIVVGRGRVRVERDDVVLTYRGPGDVIGESLFVSTEPYVDRIVAAEALETLRLPAPFLRALFTADPELARGALALLSASRAEVERRITTIVGLEIAPRLARFLLACADRWGVPSPTGTLVAATLTHLEIARAIGSTRETVTLALGALRREGLVDLQGRRILLKDREALEAKS